MRTVAIVNQKGGCGKTTSSINLAGALAAQGRPTLLVDLDPQSHCAAGLAVPEQKIDLSSADLLAAGAERTLDQTRLLWRVGKCLELAPSTVRLAGLEAPRGGIADKADRDQRLADALSELADRFEFCVIDCPPSIGLLTFNALRAADEVLIPVETSFLSLHGAQRQVQTIRSLGRRLGGQTPWSILPTMHNPESALARDVMSELNRAFAQRVVASPIRFDPKLREAVSFGQHVLEYAPASSGAEDYRALAEWLVERTEAGPPTYDEAGEVVVRVRGPRAPEPSTVSAESVERARADLLAARGRGEGEPGSLEAPISRGRDLADRARRLLARSAEIQDRMRTRSAVHLVEDERETEPTRHASRRPTDLYGVRETSRGALFVHPASPRATVAIAGDFNGWSPSAHPMRYNEQMGVHEATVELPPGDYQYRLVVDGAWIADPFNKTTRTNPYGGTNSAFTLIGSRREAAVAAEGSD